ncbi:hypothetical protein [Providencia burhodogranariea]|uniref:Uncharacterized protein n=1 Tax=Providencia burhodogranariea DSM 19968 TaxID=1141662 RepID=K8WXN0_9GAMM|nr:hypothetical protein [Providencia burhodogranariea]EKT62157.1 hypothetical protein OOA_07902 [Providencia burhodogranariea DSM 19968]
MKRFSVLVWIGLIVNILLLVSIWYFTSSFNEITGELTYPERDLVNILSFMVIPFCISIIMQIISLPVLFKMPKLGLTLAIIGSIVMLPLSLIFMTGYFYSYETYRNKNFAIFDKQPTDISLNFKSSQLTMLGIVYIVLGLFIGFIGLSMGWLFAGVGLVALCNSFRLKDRIMVGIVKDQLIITPSLYADTYMIPLNDVSLIKESKSLFKLHIKSAGVDRKCTFRKGMIEGRHYQVALADILSKLATKQNKQ